MPFDLPLCVLESDLRGDGGSCSAPPQNRPETAQSQSMFLEREKQTEEEEEGNAPKWEATCSSLAVELIPPHESMHTGQQDTLVPLITPARPKHRFEPEIEFRISSLAPLDQL